MERPILLLFERRQLIIPQRQPFSSSTVFAPFIDSRARMSSRVCFWASPPDVKDIGGGGWWSQWKFKFQLFSSRRKERRPRKQGRDFDVNRVNKAERTWMKKHNDLFFRPPLLSPLSPRPHVSFFIYSRPDHPLLPRCCASFPLGHAFGGGRGIIPAYRDLVNDPIRNRVSSRLIRIARFVLYDLARNRIETRFYPLK